MTSLINATVRRYDRPDWYGYVVAETDHTATVRWPDTAVTREDKADLIMLR